MSIYLLILLFKYVKNESLLNILLSIVFLEKIDKKLFNFIKNYPSPPQNYFYNWDVKKNIFSTSFPFCNYILINLYIDISTNFSQHLVKSLTFQLNSPYPEIIAIVTKYEKLPDDCNTFNNVLEDLLSKFQNSEYSIMLQYHKMLSFATGINVGLLASESKEKNVFKLIEKSNKKFRVIARIFI